MYGIWAFSQTIAAIFASFLNNNMIQGDKAMKIDYHIHTLCSDGVYTVDELFPIIQANHIESFSITDHDTISGIKRAKQLCSDSICFIEGIEITCSELFFPAVGSSLSLHILGYGFDENHPDFIKTLSQRRHNVMKVFESLCLSISAAGYPIRVQEVPVSCGTVLQLCDIRNCIKLKYGAVPKEVGTILDSYSVKLNAANLSVQDGIRLIHQAGGTAVWAHPFYVYQNFQKVTLTREQILMILNYLNTNNLEGLDGLEANYSAFCENDRIWLRDLASNYHLFYTAGSDFHGSPGRDYIGMELDKDVLKIHHK